MNDIQIPGPGWKLLVQGTIADLYVVPNDRGEPVVAKVLREISEETRLSIAREYRVLAARVHAGLIPVLGGDLTGPRPYYFMPFLSGGPLTKWAGALDHGTLRNVTRWIAEAMAALHANDIQHGDIKPDNVLLSRSGTVQVSDPLGNGSGCTVSLGTKCGGTPGYWAPEIARGAPISQAGDVYSLGATLFHLATAIAPHDEMALDPLAHGVSLPGDLQRAVLAMCASDPARRPSMQQVVSFLTGITVAPSRPRNPPPKTVEQSPPDWLKALKWLGVAAGVAAVVNGATKSWDPNVGQYRGSNGKFRGGGLFD